MAEKSRGNKMIEAVRGIMSILVVFCHFKLPAAVSDYVIAAARSAVPFFLILSGYFIWKADTEKTVKTVKKKIVDTLLLICRMVIVYSVVNTVVALLKGREPLSWVYGYLNLKALKDFLLYNRGAILCSTAYYLFMVLYVLVIFLVILKLKAVNLSMYLIPVLLAANIIRGEVLALSWVRVGNWIFTGLPFFLLGVLLAKTKFRMKPVNCILTCVYGLILTEIECYINENKGVFLFVGSIFLSVGAFMLCLALENVRVPKIIAGFGSEFSMGLFMYHCAVGYLLSPICKKLGISFGVFKPLVIIAVTVLLVFIWNLITGKYRKKTPKPEETS